MKSSIRSGGHGYKGAPESAQCTGKQGYPNGASAWQMAKTIKKHGKKGGMAVYRCPHCGEFRIGGQFG